MPQVEKRPNSCPVSERFMIKMEGEKEAKDDLKVGDLARSANMGWVWPSWIVVGNSKIRWTLTLSSLPETQV